MVVNSANAAKALVELSNNLPNSGGIVSWFTGDNDIASFGEKLVSFGQSFAAYYASVSTVDVAKLSGVVAQFRNLVDLANGITSVDTSGMSRFAQDLTNLGNSGIEGFINAFNNASSRVSAAATSMLTTFINAANAQKSAGCFNLYHYGEQRHFFAYKSAVPVYDYRQHNDDEFHHWYSWERQPGQKHFLDHD